MNNQTTDASPKKPYGLGGWLILFQIRLLGTLLLAIFQLPPNSILSNSQIILLIACVILFYSKISFFKYAYIAVVVIDFIILLPLILDISKLNEWALNFAFDVLFIGLLFTSKRVKNTFRIFKYLRYERFLARLDNE